MRDDKPPRPASSIILAIAYTGMLGASYALISDRPDLATRVGRHLWAGALAIAALVAVEVLICLIPYRKGETWARWAALLPFLILGIPIFVIDARYVPAATRLRTLLPQAIGLLFGIGILLRSAVQRWNSRAKDQGVP